MINYINNTNKPIIILKIGSSLLVENSNFREEWLSSLASDIVQLKDRYNFIIVSSGAIALACLEFNKKKSDLSITQKQAYSSVGQIYLMNNFCRIFQRNNITISQILLTYSDCNSINRRLNFQNTINELLSLNIIPIINENDAIATDEIRIGDNDTLAAYVANITNASKLILFSDIDGLYNKNPQIYDDAIHIKAVKKITQEIKDMASVAISDKGTGGMITKINSAIMLEDTNCTTIIACGKDYNCLSKLMNNQINYTVFSANNEKF